MDPNQTSCFMRLKLHQNVLNLSYEQYGFKSDAEFHAFEMTSSCLNVLNLSYKCGFKSEAEFLC